MLIVLRIILLSSCPTVHQCFFNKPHQCTTIPNISPTDLGCSGRATWPRQSCRPVCCVVTDQRNKASKQAVCTLRQNLAHHTGCNGRMSNLRAISLRCGAAN